MARRGSSLGSRARVLSSLARGPAQRVGGQDTPQRRPRPLSATTAVFSASLLGLGPSYPQLKAPLETPLVRDTFPCEGRGLADWARAPAEVF